MRTTLLSIAALGLFATAFSASASAAASPSDVECSGPDEVAVPSAYCDYVNGVLDDPQNACDTGDLGFVIAFCEGHGPFEPCPQSHCPPKPGE